MIRLLTIFPVTLWSQIDKRSEGSCTVLDQIASVAFGECVEVDTGSIAIETGSGAYLQPIVAVLALSFVALLL